MTTEEFIKKSKEKFPNLFTYEKTCYTKNDSSIIITYNGVDFVTTPHYHLRKSSKNGGCKYLSSGVNPNMSRDERLEKLIDMSKKRFGDRFSYDKISNYENNNSYLTFVCNIHGDFMTTFSNHLRKDRSSGGCPMCGKAIGGRSSNDAKKMFFIQKSKKIFGDDRFDYSNVFISGLSDNDNITLICNKHHISFDISAPDHFRSKNSGGCPMCQKETRISRVMNSRSLKYDSYIETAKFVHLNKYDYSKIDRSIPVNSKNKIICPIHGDFEQSMMSHISGRGCKKCSDWRKDSLAAKHFKNANIPTSSGNSEYIIECDDELKNKPYDLYISRLNLLIEIQGEQHFKKKWNMTDDDFKNRLRIDVLKKQKALSYGYNYLEIKCVDDLKIVFNVIEILKNSTTIEIFESAIKEFDSMKVEYTSFDTSLEKQSTLCEDIV